MFAHGPISSGLLSATLAALTIGSLATGCSDPDCALTLTTVNPVAGHAPFGAQLDFSAANCQGEPIGDLASTGTFSLAGPAGSPAIEAAALSVTGYPYAGLDGMERRFSLGFCAPAGAAEGTYTLSVSHSSGNGTLSFKLSGAFDGSACSAPAVASCGGQCSDPDCGATVGCCKRTSCGSGQCGDDGCGLSCGSCGVGESCSPGNQCVQPFAIVSGEQDPRGITTDDDSLFWTLDSGAAVKSSAKDGSEPLVLANVSAWAVQVDKQDAFWTAHTTGEVMKAAKDGTDVDATGAPAPIVLASGQQDPRGLALDQTHVYWTDVSGDAVRRVSKEGGTIEELATKQSSPRDVFVHGDYVYWTNSASGTVLEDGSVHRVLKTGGTVEPVAAGLNAPWAIFVDDTHVYWTSYTEQGAVMRAPKAGGDPLVLAQGFANPRDIDGFGDSIYWLSVGTPNGSGEFISGAVYTLRKDLSAGGTIGAGQKWLGSMVVDSSGVYWTQAGTLQSFFADGRLMGAWK